MTAAADDAALRPVDDVNGRKLANAQIVMGSLVTAYGQLTDNFGNPAAWGMAGFFVLLQGGMSHRAWQARLLWRRGHWGDRVGQRWRDVDMRVVRPCSAAAVA